MVVHDDAECKEEWNVKYAGEITFVESVGPKSSSEVDLEIEVRCEMVRQKGAVEMAGGGWEVPEIEVRWLVRGGRRCCGKVL